MLLSTTLLSCNFGSKCLLLMGIFWLYCRLQSAMMLHFVVCRACCCSSDFERLDAFHEFLLALPSMTATPASLGLACRRRNKLVLSRFLVVCGVRSTCNNEFISFSAGAQVLSASVLACPGDPSSFHACLCGAGVSREIVTCLG